MNQQQAAQTAQAGVPLAHLLTPALLHASGAALGAQLAQWPQLASVPLDNAELVYRSGLLPRLAELEQSIARGVAEASARCQAHHSAGRANEAESERQLAHALHALHGAVGARVRQVEAALAAASPAAASPVGQAADDEAEPGSDGPIQQQQQSQQQSQARQAAYAYPMQQAPSAAAHYQSAPAAVPSTAVASGVAAASAPAAPVSVPPAAPVVRWILPPDRRKLPGDRYQKIRTIRKTLFGKVSLFFDTRMQRRVAIKLSNKALLLEGRTTSGNQVAENPLEELKFLRVLSRQNEADGGQPQQLLHPGQAHVLQLLDECEDETDLWSVLEFCVAEDMQLLTQQGFLFLHEVEAAMEDEAVGKGSSEPLRFASYNPHTQQLEYHAATRLTINPPTTHMLHLSSPHERARWGEDAEVGVEQSEAASEAVDPGVSLVVTPAHDMFVRRGTADAHAQPVPQPECGDENDTQAERVQWTISPHGGFERRKAGQLLSSDPLDRLQLLSHARAGVHQPKTTTELPFCQSLKLQSQHVLPFLSLYGFALHASQLLRPCPFSFPSALLLSATSPDQLQFLRDTLMLLPLQPDEWTCADSTGASITASHWVDWFASLPSTHSSSSPLSPPPSALPSASPCPSSSAPLPSWVWLLEQSQVCALLDGLRLAQSQHPLDSSPLSSPSSSPSLSSFSSSSTPSQVELLLHGATRREELLRLCLHAGYSAHFVRAPLVMGDDCWLLRYTSTTSLAAPTLRPARDVRLRSNSPSQRSWCVTLPPHHLLLTRRAHAEDGVVVRASRPTIVGNCGKGEFFDIVCAATRFDEARARHYFIQMAQGVAYLHAHLICHLDMSLENLLMDDNDQLKICDFGVARMMSLDQNRHLVAYPGIKKNKPGKIGYMSPEMFAGHSFYGHLSDVYAMGVILFICLTGVPPYQLPSLSDQRFALIYNGQLSKLLHAWNMQNIMSAAAKDIISRMICPPERRMNIQQVLAHPFVTGQA